MAISTLQPNFQMASAEEKAIYDLFYDYTSSEKIQGYASGWNLQNLAYLADKVCSILEKTNPILQEGSPQTAIISGRQWQINQLSDVKQRLASAIGLKRDYYENHWFGKITKYVLECFGQWNNGDTTAIAYAEDFLIRYDSRCPLFKGSDGHYSARFFFFLLPASWIRDNLDTSRFFNYTPRRTLPVAESVRNDALNPFLVRA